MLHKDEIKRKLADDGEDAAIAYMALPSFNPRFRLDAKSAFGRAFNQYINGVARELRYMNLSSPVKKW